jgi:hypothetical protein
MSSTTGSAAARPDSPRRSLWHVLVPILALALACTSRRLYFLHSELPVLENNRDLAVAPGPWPEIPAVLSDPDQLPDELVLPTLRALMTMPGAADACDPATRRPRRDATEYCVAVYRTPQDWRVSWPIRRLTGEIDRCKPPYGGVEDADFGRDMPVFGFAHNHLCETSMSSPDLKVSPAMKSGEGTWMMVGFATTPSGKLARDSRGQPVPAWGWLATGRIDKPIFYKWNLEGEVFKWSEEKKRWEFQATCEPQEPTPFSQEGNPPKCFPELN